MKPVLFSVKEALLGRATWVRTGFDIYYHKNHYIKFPPNSQKEKFKRTSSSKNYYTVTMTIQFPHTNDVVYLAYHYPYTFTKLQVTYQVFYKLLGKENTTTKKNINKYNEVNLIVSNLSESNGLYYVN